MPSDPLGHCARKCLEPYSRREGFGDYLALYHRNLNTLGSVECCLQVDHKYYSAKPAFLMNVNNISESRKFTRPHPKSLSQGERDFQKAFFTSSP